MSSNAWEVVIGLEVHAQLSTVSKIFSGAATAFGAAPNTQACAVDLAFPGVLPTPNYGAIERAIKFGLAVDAQITPLSVFARKNYFYPDLPKGYQISQYELPIVAGGEIWITHDGMEKKIRLTRAHLEEDAGKSLHEAFQDVTGVDLNRAGTPLLEIVSEPDIRSSKEAVVYAKALHSLVRYLEICDGNMQEGSFRCDANVSVRPNGSQTLGTRCEIKNLNSFRFLERAIDYEVERQINLLEEGGKVAQETRLYDSANHETRSMRSKEDAHDYRYFPDPDLLPIEVTPEWIAEVRETLPELPRAKAQRYTEKFGLSIYDAGILTSNREIAAYFEAALQYFPSQPKLIANWIIGEVSARLNKDSIEIDECPLKARALADLIKLIADGTLSNRTAKEVFDAMWRGEGDAEIIVEAKGLKQISDSSAIEKLIDGIIAANPAQVAEYRAGREKLYAFFVGQAMKASGGKVNPVQLNDLLRKKLSG